MPFDVVGAALLRLGALAMLSMSAMPAVAADGSLCSGKPEQMPMACHAGCVLDDRRAPGKRLPGQ
jgi:hypothetical protein